MNSIANGTMPMAPQMGAIPNTLNKEQAQAMYHVGSLFPSPLHFLSPFERANPMM